MKKVLCVIWIAAVILFFIDWGMVGLSLLNGNYEIEIGVYLGLVCMVIIMIGPICKICKMLSNKCPYCGKTILSDYKFCPYCAQDDKLWK